MILENIKNEMIKCPTMATCMMRGVIEINNYQIKIQ